MADIHESSLEPAQFLVEKMSLFRKGKALDPAPVNGRNAVYLAGMSYKIEQPY